MTHGKLSENVTLDDERDIVTAYGVRIHGDLFRAIGTPTPDGRWFRVVSVEDGVATIEQRTDLVQVVKS
jgi:hypothetical protein